MGRCPAATTTDVFLCQIDLSGVPLRRTGLCGTCGGLAGTEAPLIVKKLRCLGVAKSSCVLFALKTFSAQDKFQPPQHLTPSFVVAMRALLALFVAGAAAVSVDELSKWFESAEGAIETALVVKSGGKWKVIRNDS